MSRSHYRILSVATDATSDQIKSAYRKIALKLHPDMTDGCKIRADEFKEASEAYRVLSNKQLRQVYDSSEGINMNRTQTGTPAENFNRNARNDVSRQAHSTKNASNDFPSNSSFLGEEVKTVIPENWSYQPHDYLLFNRMRASGKKHARERLHHMRNVRRSHQANSNLKENESQSPSGCVLS